MIQARKGNTTTVRYLLALNLRYNVLQLTSKQSPYDSLYRRSFEPVPDDQSSRSAAGRSHHSHGHHDDDDDSYDYKSQGQISRPRDEYPDSSSGRSRGQSRGQSRGGRYSQTGYDSTEGSPIGREGDGSEEGKRRLSGAVGKEKKDIAATLIGAAAGAFLGHESTQGKGFGTLGGALLGGLSANAIEHRHLK